MSRDLGPCPPADDLERLLTEQLSGSLRESVETHVESCSTCQGQLERLSIKPARTVKITVAGAGSGPEPSAEFLRRLRGTPPSWPNGKSPSTSETLDRLPRWFERGRIGQYEILEKLGKGGMGTVYKARHAELGKIVALKVLPADQMDEVRIGRFKNEVRAIGQLDHEHIVAAHDAGEVSGVHFLVMDFVDGEDLGRVVDRYGRLSVPDACAAIREAALGLQHAFERGIVHRDIKPSNLMLTRTGRVQVLDLGLARSFRDLSADRLTADGMVLGTADYLAPEQWERARAVDIRADIYSLGCSLYHLLAGRPPFGGKHYSSLLEKLRGHVDTPPPAITGLRPEIPAGLVAVLDRMLAKSPADRFATPAEVAEAIRPFAAGSELARLVGPGAPVPPRDAAATPVPAMLDTATDSRRLRRVPMRRRYLVPAAAAAVALAIVAVVLFWPRGGRSSGPVAQPLTISNMRVDHYRGDEAKTSFLGNLHDSEVTVRVKDQVTVAAELGTPAYYYLIAFNPAGSKAGTVQLCQPDDAAGEGMTAATPGKHKEVRYPRDDGLVELDAAGLQVFVLAASTQPLPPFAEWRNSVRDIPWKGTHDGGTWRWHFDGSEFHRHPSRRANLSVVVPEPLRELRDWFTARPEFEVVQMFAFPVVDDRKKPAAGAPPRAPLNWPPTLDVAFLGFPVPVPSAAPPGAPAAPLPQLSKADEEWVQKKYKEAAEEFGEKGKWGVDEAQKPVREILDVCTRKLGKDHYRTAWYRLEIECLEKLSKLPESDRLEYMQTYVSTKRMMDLWNQSKYADAAEQVKPMLATYRRLLGPEHHYVAMADLWYGQLLVKCDRFDQAEQALREALEIRRKAFGEYTHQTIEAYIHLAVLADRRAKYDEGERLDQTALAISRRLLGNRHWQTAVCLNNVAVHFERQARYAEAEDCYRQSLAIFIAIGGEDGPGVVRGRTNLAVTLDSQGKFAAAEKEFRQVLIILRKAAKKDDEEIAFVSGNLATNLDAQARHTEAEHLHRTAIDTCIRIYGESHSQVALFHSNLAVNLDHQGKYPLGQTHLEKALKIYLDNPGLAKSVSTAVVYSNLASCLGGQRKHSEAQAAAEKAVAIYRDLLPADHPNLAAAYNNLAASLKNQDKYDEAEPISRRVMAVDDRRLKEDHPDRAHAHTALAVILYYQGRFGEAEPHLQWALDSLRRGVGEGHTETAWTYKSLIGNYCARGEYAKAEALAEAATKSFEAARLRLGFAGLDRALRTEDISPLPGLAVVAARRGKQDVAWQALETNMARGLLDHLAAEPLAPEDREREQALLEDLNRLDRQLNKLRERAPKTDDDRKVVDDRIKKAEVEREAALAKLVEFQATVAEKGGATAGRIYKLADIQKQIPDDAALVAWVDLPLVPDWHDREGDHWACVLKRTGPPVWVQLRGARGGWTKEDDQLTDRFRNAVKDSHSKEDWKDLKERLARQRLGPLKNDLNGIRHLVVLPSGWMAGIPVEALTDLIVSYAPSGTMFAALREKHAAAAATKIPRYLLALGDPEFKKGDDSPPDLPGSRQELTGITRVFDLTREFKAAEATEQNLDKVAAEEGGLRRFPYLHFATHGVLDEQRPMRSALLLARGSQADPLQRLLEGKEVYDGRLTAERILRRWKLDAELVTLSACQTGLGRKAGGDGYLGFSQALFVAGARSLVVSLWEVDDTATSLLMTRFYENLMGLSAKLPGGPIEPKPKAQALAEAKKWLRELTTEQVKELAVGLPRHGTRGRIVKKGAVAEPVLSYDHPYYWSGFILVGDP